MPAAATKNGDKTRGRRSNPRLPVNHPKVPPPAPEPTAEHEDTSDEDEEEDDEGVDEEGMQKLMAALGEDGLDDYEVMQLESLNGNAAEDQEGSEELESGDEDEEDELVSGDDEDAEVIERSGESGSEEDEDEDENEEAGVAVAAGTSSSVGAGSDDEVDEEDDEDAVALDEVESVDDDAVPRQKIEIDNKVRPVVIVPTL
jgi:rRNA-processing protein EBP2